MQGFNMGRYIPPEHEGLTSANALHGKHALGARAAKSHLGILTVRFEMPFPIWCTSCPKPTIIGQGVRFNAEKKKVGAYHTTPIYAFRMKHAACGGALEIRTDPRNTAYVVTEGARKRDTGDDVVREGDTVVLTEAEREERRTNAFVGLEGKAEEAQRVRGARERILDLQAAQGQWADPYAQNRRLRAAFRGGRAQREREAAAAGALQDRMSLGIELLAGTREDELRAQLVEFGRVEEAGGALRRPLFGGEGTERERAGRRKTPLKAEARAERSKAAFAAALRSNTRAKLDPFLARGAPLASGKLALGIKRKRGEAEEGGGVGKGDEREKEDAQTQTQTLGTGLVDYESE